MGEFPTTTLEQLAAPEKGAISIGPFGSRMKTDVYVESGVRVIRGTNISSDNRLVGDWVYVSKEFSETIPNCIAYPGDLVFPHRGSIGEVALIGEEEEPLVISSSMMKFRPDQTKADPRFIVHYFKSRQGREEILRFASSVGTPGIGQPLTSLRQFRLPHPELPVQRRVADTLSILNDKIELNRRTNETLEAMAQAIFKDWFVDFGPARRKQAGETDPSVVLGGLLPAGEKATQTAALFPNSFGDNGLPEGWDIRKIEEVFDVSIGRTPPRKEREHFVSSGLGQPWLSIKTMGKSEVYVVETEENLTLESVEKYRVPVVPAGTLLVSFKMTVGRVAFADAPMATNEAIAHLKRTRTTPVSQNYAYCFMKSFDYRSLGSTSSIATAVNSKSIKSIEMTVPTNEVSSHFAQLVDPVFGKLKVLERQNQTLAQTRDYLLPKLMSGQIRASDAKRMVA